MERKTQMQITKLSRHLFIPDPPPPELVQRGHRSQIFYNNIQLLIPIIITITATIICIAFTVVCYKYRKFRIIQNNVPSDEPFQPTKPTHFILLQAKEAVSEKTQWKASKLLMHSGIDITLQFIR